MKSVAEETQEQFGQHKYRVLMELGEGGTAHVFLAIARGPSGFNKLVVLKALKRSLVSDEDFRRMFMNEARLSARLNHPNIGQVNEVIEQDGLPVIVMQYLEGRPLLEIINRAGTKLSLGMHLQIICDSLSGLHYSHELCDYDGTPLQVVHRDMTPHNVFVTFDGQVKLLDFGIAKLSGSVVETQEGVLKGKLRYMPPEQIMGEAVDRRTDIYAVGVMLWEAATGLRMWRTLAEATIMNRVLEGRIPTPRSEQPQVDEALESIILKALATDASDRYSTVLELQGELENYMAAHNLGSSPREIGSFVADLFTDFRQETKKAIEEKLAREGSLTWAESGSISIAPSASVSRQSKELLSPQTKQRRQLIAWVIGSILCVTLVLLFALIWKNARLPTTTSSGRSGSMAIPSTLGSPDLAPVHWVNLRISASPASAVILIDGKSIAGNPASISVEGDGSSHTVTVQAADHKPRLLSIVYDRDQDVVVALEQAAAATNATPKASHQPRLSPLPPASSPVIPPKDCDPPYYMDERGIKRFKSGCI
jgi:serine/threonine-protein kinase